MTRYEFTVGVCSGPTASLRTDFCSDGSEKDEGSGFRADCACSLLVGDAPLPGGQHVIEGVSADAGPGEANQSTAMR